MVAKRKEFFRNLAIVGVSSVGIVNFVLFCSKGFTLNVSSLMDSVIFIVSALAVILGISFLA